MYGLLLVAQLFVADREEIKLPIKPNLIDIRYFESLRQEAERLKENSKRRRSIKGACPFEPGTYSNVECA